MSDSARDPGPGRHRRADPLSLWAPDPAEGPAEDPAEDPADRDPAGWGAADDRTYLPAAGPEHHTPGRVLAALLDRLPPGLTGARLALGRHWWLPALVALGALAVAVAAVRFGGPSAGLPVAQPPAVSAVTTAASAATPTGTDASSPAAPTSSGSSATTSAHPTTAAPSAPSVPAVVPAVVVVDVVGHVRRPGVVRLPAGARVTDAVVAAGGAVPGTDVSAINLARPVTDGQQIRVGLGSPWLVDAVTGGGADGSGTGGAGGTAPPGSPPVPTTGSSSGAGGGTAVPAGPLDLNTATVEELDALPGVGPATAAKILAWRTEHGRFASVDDLDEVSGIGPAKLADLRPLVRV